MGFGIICKKENYKKYCIFIGLFVFFISIIISDRVFSYDTDIAHPHIVDFAVDIYNKNYDPDLSEEEIKWIRQGAMEEDTPFRWFNHFYDPVYNVGLSDGSYGTAKEWAQNPNAQRGYNMGDYSWQRAIYDYQHGDKKQALIGLGHIVHLISDMGVPAHTRDDSHPEGDPYEVFVKDNYDVLVKGLTKLEMKEYYFDNLNNYFDNLAKYSNNNFYSKDTIANQKYNTVGTVRRASELSSNGKKYLYNYALIDGVNYRLYAEDTQSWIGDSKTVDNNEILIDYTKLLFPKAVGYSAGAIKLFFEEVKKENNTEMIGEGVSGKVSAVFKFGANAILQANESKFKTQLTSLLSSLSLNNAALFQASVHGAELTKAVLEQKQQNSILYSERESTATKITQLASYLLKKGENIKDTLPKSSNTALADENTVIKIMEQKEDVLNKEEKPSKENIKLTALEIKPVQPTNSVIIESQTEQEQNIVEEESKPIKSIILPSQPPKTEPPKPIEPKQAKYTSEPQFVFGSGGERTPSVPAPAPIVPAEVVIENPPASATTTEDISETPTSTEEIILDTTAPGAPGLEVSFVIATSTTTSSTIDIFWQSTANDLAGYDLDFKKDNEDWINIFTRTTSTQYQMFVDKFHDYAFRVNATDTSTNTSNWSEKSVLVDYPKTVVINEIAWMGTASNRPQDEWLELYNNTDQDINLTGWKIKATNNYFTWNNTSSTIKAHDYYLLERTNDDTTVSDILADRIFTLSGGLNNNGENLVLLNNSGEIIDQVDNSGGFWFAGQKDTKYKTMERINSNKPGTQASNWQTSDTFSYKGKGQGGVRIYGTPRQPNKGYWYLQNLTTNYTFDETNTLILTEDNSPYFIDAPTEIPVGYTLKLEEGVVIVGVLNASYLSVKGNLIIEGTSEKPVIFTSARDTNYVPKNYSNLLDGNPEAGDWSRIEIVENGKLTANNVKFIYGGQKYFLQGGFMFGGKFPVRIINNLGGEVSLDHATFQNNFIRTDNTDQTYDSIVWIEPALGLFATTTINNSLFDGGYLAVKNAKQNNYLSISNSTFKNFTNTTGAISSRYDLPIMENNVFENNARNTVEIQQFTISKDTPLDAQSEYTVNNITIDTGATLKILPGTIINLANKGDITVNGSLEAIGTASDKITIRPTKTDEQWGSVIFTNSTSTLEFADLTGGNNGSVRTPQTNGMLWIKDSNITLNNVSLTDARRPYNMVYSKDSTLRIIGSEISWSTPKESNGQTIDGINLDGGYLYLNNTTFNQMDRGIEVYNLSTIETENMTLGHFTNMTDLNWWPIDVIRFE